ncbi:hypothetical protein D9615_007383 [Tricholomella constricta]|uniref:SWI5-dependent HO expression protein 3 n=1 Tax=Tricholomella constricta TaxID=117010 RepID=A0A8H5GXX2_9AGAR|nr:hypothetical protein D9615_007383 [Tricholomella constricta]
MSSSPGHSYPSSSANERGLSPLKPIHRDRSHSRNSSRTSVRSARPSSPSFSFDDPVAIRNQVSTLKHTIRHQQAQLHSLENILLIGPRGLQDTFNEMTSPTSPPPSSYTPTASTSTKVKRRSSYDILHGIAGPESHLPLPKRDGPDENGIQEGIPMSFGVGPSSPQSYKRASSPMRTLSRIPVASVGNARALADEGQPPTQRPSLSTNKASPVDPDSSQASLQPPPSPNRRLSLTPGGTTKVLADLQTGVVNARNALENTKAQLRLSQRSVAQLTRQTEDLKEGRERLRLENEGLNNVVARKERLLQEVLERARKAEAEAATLRSQLKSETTSAKKSVQEMKTALSESTALSQKSEREYITLRDSIKGLVESWKADTERLREEMLKREEKVREEAESVGKKYKTLLEEVRLAEGGRVEVKKLRELDKRVSGDVEQAWQDEIARLKAEIERNSKENEDATSTAQSLSNELARLRRLMQAAGRDPGTSSTIQTAPP